MVHDGKRSPGISFFSRCLEPTRESSGESPFLVATKRRTRNDVASRVFEHTGKYTCLRPNTTATVSEPWQYWVDDGVDGKADGWYDYDDAGAATVEQLHMEFKSNPGLFQRVVASGV